MQDLYRVIVMPLRILIKKSLYGTAIALCNGRRKQFDRNLRFR
jgi:hypothetical protein